MLLCFFFFFIVFVFFQAEDGIRDLVRSRGLGDVYKRQPGGAELARVKTGLLTDALNERQTPEGLGMALANACLLYTSDAAEERSSVDLGGRRIIKKKKTKHDQAHDMLAHTTTNAD